MFRTFAIAAVVLFVSYTSVTAVSDAATTFGTTKANLLTHAALIQAATDK